MMVKVLLYSYCTGVASLTRVCKNEIIATNRPATSGFRPTPE